MLTKRLSELHNIHEGKKIIVCGCGTSLLDFKDHHTDFITIGVNDVPALFDPTYSLVTDHPVRFSDARKKIVNESKSKALLTCVKGWTHDRIVMFKLGKRGIGNLTDPNKVDHFLNSPYAAINIAYKMGARTIGMVGVDFSKGHFYSTKDGDHSLRRMGYMSDIDAGYLMIDQELKKNNAKLYNLSPISTVKHVEHITLEDFRKL